MYAAVDDNGNLLVSRLKCSVAFLLFDTASFFVAGNHRVEWLYFDQGGGTFLWYQNSGGVLNSLKWFSRRKFIVWTRLGVLLMGQQVGAWKRL